MDDLENYSDRIKKELISDLKSGAMKDVILSDIAELKDIKVLVIGDTIIDEYVFCDSMGRAKKEPILVFKHKYSESYAGGILAVANHVAEFSDNVTVVTSTGNDLLIEELVSKYLNKKITMQFFKDISFPTITKRRYVNYYRTNKFFEVYNKDPENLLLPEKEIIQYLDDYIDSFDMVIVGDFGHGIITEKIKSTLEDKSKYLAVNVQTNSGNFGYNLITKINKADYISLTSEELQLAMQDKKSDLKELIKKLSLQTKCKKICITLGKEGVLYFDNWSFSQVPIFSDKVVDTIGAGDAVFSITSLLTYKNKNPKIIPFVGNCTGALAVQILGNKRPVKNERLQEFIKNILD